MPRRSFKPTVSLSHATETQAHKLHWWRLVQDKFHFRKVWRYEHCLQVCMMNLTDIFSSWAYWHFINMANWCLVLDNQFFGKTWGKVKQSSGSFLNLIGIYPSFPILNWFFIYLQQSLQNCKSTFLWQIFPCILCLIGYIQSIKHPYLIK